MPHPARVPDYLYGRNRGGSAALADNLIRERLGGILNEYHHAA
ncbi:hypothetical protein AB0I53_22115 [Saccharopolyspora sp. NPDC050389]